MRRGARQLLLRFLLRWGVNYVILHWIFTASRSVHRVATATRLGHAEIVSAAEGVECSAVVPQSNRLPNSRMLSILPLRRRVGHRGLNVSNTKSGYDSIEGDSGNDNTHWVSTCRARCEVLYDGNTTVPLSWENCPSEPLHFDSGASEIRWHAIAPRIRFKWEGAKTKEGSTSSGSSDWRAVQFLDHWRSTETQANLLSSYIPTFSIAVKPVTELPLERTFSFPVGTTVIEFQGIVTENACTERKSWNDRTQYSQHHAPFSVGSTLLSCTIEVIVHDKELPTFVFCPGHREFRLTKGNSRVAFHYDRPIATDNSRVRPRIYQTRGEPSGERLGPGRHVYEFVAEDREGNRAVCSFTVRVFRYVEEPDAPRSMLTAPGWRFGRTDSVFQFNDGQHQPPVQS